MAKINERRKICVEISEDVWKKFCIIIIEKYGKVRGKIRQSTEEAILEWIKINKGSELRL